MSRSRLSRAIALVLFWLIVGAFNASQTYLQVTIAGMHHSFWRILGWEEAVWTSWALFTPLILSLKLRVPVERPPWRGIPVHLAAGGAVAAAHVFIGSAAAWLFDPFSMKMMPARHRFRTSMTGSLSSDLLVYGAILAAAYGFDYFTASRERELRASQLEAQLSDSRLTALKLQIQPHFLFNTLHSIAGLVRTGKNPEAVRMIAGLSEMLRYTLEQPGQEISLGEELQMLERYLEIQKVRFGPRLDVKLSIDPETRGARVPVLLLQPLAENALRHGIEKCAGAGSLEVVSRRAGNRLQLEIRDSGPGLSAASPRDGVGLGVTKERLNALYGGSHSFRLEDAPGGGAAASIDIPWNDAD
jgi:signal transduction histidine kinase